MQIFTHVWVAKQWLLLQAALSALETRLLPAVTQQICFGRCRCIVHWGSIPQPHCREAELTEQLAGAQVWRHRMKWSKIARSKNDAARRRFSLHVLQVCPGLASLLFPGEDPSIAAKISRRLAAEVGCPGWLL